MARDRAPRAADVLRWRVVESPVGPLRLAAEDAYLRHVLFTDEPAEGAPPVEVDDPPEPGSREDLVLTEAARQLAEYFAGEREQFDLLLGPRGTDFQRRVWRALAAIPYGTTVSYGEIADRLGLPPGSARAVGVANSQNPLPIVVPCHRVIGADGGLTGFGGGLARKETLLALEGSSLF